MAERSHPENLWRRILPFTRIGVVVALVYLLAVFGWRWHDAWQLRQKQQAEAKERARRDVEAAGGWSLKILHLSATPAVVRAGEAVNICYGTADARKVTFEPPLEGARPSYTNCLQARPRQDTVYKLTAEDSAGRQVTSEVKVLVR